MRDELLGRPVADRDWVVVGATPEMLIASGYKPVGRDFPVFLHPETREEYALARTERKHGRGYRGFEFFVVARRHARRGPRAPRSDDQRDGARRAGHADRSLTAGRPISRRGVLRHVSPAFVEDPLRVLRVARFAARFGFAVAPETAALMRALVASGELAQLAPERVWQELARGLAWSRTRRGCSRCCATAGRSRSCCPKSTRCTPRRFRVRGARRRSLRARLALALDHAAKREYPLPVRYAVLAHDFGDVGDRGRGGGASPRTRRAACGCAERCRRGSRCRVDCRDAARLAARWHRSSIARPSCRRRPCSTCSTLPTRCAARSGSRRCCDACECVALSAPDAAGRFRARAARARGARRREGRRRRRDRPRGGAEESGRGTRGRDRESRALGAARALRAWKRAGASWRPALTRVRGRGRRMPRAAGGDLDPVRDEPHHVRRDAHQRP